MTFIRLGVPTHFRPSSDNKSACGIVNPRYAAHDGRDVDCLLCRRTKAWKQYMGTGRNHKEKANE